MSARKAPSFSKPSPSKLRSQQGKIPALGSEGIEAMMLFRIKEVRSDLRKFSGPARFLILLNLNELSDCCGERGRCIRRLLRSKPEGY